MTRGPLGGARTEKRYGAAWLATFLACAAALGWVFEGRALVRRALLAPPAGVATARTDRRFLAVLFPRISPEKRDRAMSSAELTRILEGLRRDGCRSVSLSDVDDFYRRGRPLPAKAVLLAFAQDDPAGLDAADRALKAVRWRGVAFVSRLARPGSDIERGYLSRHAASQMEKSGAWEFGLATVGGARPAADLGPARAILDADGRAAPAAAGAGDRAPLRFVPSDSGRNGTETPAQRLNILVLRADRRPEENMRVLAASWPRAAQFTDDFSSDGLGADWIAGWGGVSAGGRRLALVPTPRQTGAAVFLRGTEEWRDAVLEVELKRYQKEFWVYARYGSDGTYVRAGVRGGFWIVEQKAAPGSLPTMLARAPGADAALPARLRFVVKGKSALLHVNGRMLFGRALRVDPRVARGRVMLGVYDVHPKSALAVVRRVRLAPASEQWITFRSGGVMAGFADAALDGLREAAVSSRAVSPRWIYVLGDGSVHVDAEQQSLVRSLAGFYSCRLAPTVEFPSGAGALADDAAAARLAASLADAARSLDAADLNLRLRTEDAIKPGTYRFLARLRRTLRQSGRGLWLTADGPEDPPPSLSDLVDGVLRPAGRAGAPYELLAAARQTQGGRSPMETASIR